MRVQFLGVGVLFFLATLFLPSQWQAAVIANDATRLMLMLGLGLLFTAMYWGLLRRNEERGRITTCERCSGEYNTASSNAWSPERFCSAYCEGYLDGEAA